MKSKKKGGQDERKMVRRPRKTKKDEGRKVSILCNKEDKEKKKRAS